MVHRVRTITATSSGVKTEQPTMMSSPITLSNRLAEKVLLGAVLALCSIALHAQVEAGPTLRIPKSWLAQANSSAESSVFRAQYQGGPALRLPRTLLAQ